MTSYLEQENISKTVLEIFEKITVETEWIDPYDYIWLKLGTIIVYIIEGKYSSINNIKLTLHYLRAKKVGETGFIKIKGFPLAKKICLKMAALNFFTKCPKSKSYTTLLLKNLLLPILSAS